MQWYTENISHHFSWSGCCGGRPEVVFVVTTVRWEDVISSFPRSRTMLLLVWWSFVLSPISGLTVALRAERIIELEAHAFGYQRTLWK